MNLGTNARLAHVLSGGKAIPAQLFINLNTDGSARSGRATRL